MQWHKYDRVKEVIYTFEGGDRINIERPMWYLYDTATGEDNYVTAKDEYITVSPTYLSRRNVPLTPFRGEEIEPWEDF